MKPSRFLAMMLILTIFPFTGYAVGPVTSPLAIAPTPVSQPTPAADRIGIAAAVRGAVQVASSGQVGKVVESGQAIFLGDEISTDEKGSLQILLLDETTFTIGPNSAIKIDKFVYDPASHDGEVKAEVVKGVFRFMTGKIGRKNPSQMEVSLPSGTIGIRGTIVGGECIGNHSTVILFGPGQNNNTPHRIGSFVLTNGGHHTTINKAGFGSTIDGEGAAPTPPFKVPAELLAKITNALGSAPPADSNGSGSGGGQGGMGGGGESPTKQAGQDRALTGGAMIIDTSLGTLIQNVSTEATQASQKSINQSVVDDFGTFDGFTTVNQLNQLATQIGGGIQHFGPKNFNLYDTNNVLAGTGTFQLDINFTNRTFGGGNSGVTGSFGGGSLTGNFSFPLSATQAFNAFTSGNNIAAFSKTVANTSGTPCANSGCAEADIVVVFGNSGNNVANTAIFQIDVNKTGGTPVTVASNTVDTAGRSGGPS